MIRISRFLLACFAALILVFPVLAQDKTELTQTQTDLLQRLVDAQEVMLGLNTFILNTKIESSDDLTMTGTLSMNAGGTATTEITSYHILGEKPNLYGTIQYVSDNSAEVDMTITADVRVVDGVLCVQAAREIHEDDDDDPSTLPEMPEGWAIVKNLEDSPAFERLNLEPFLNSPYAWPFVDETSLWFTSPKNVQLESGTLPDGTAIDAITITYEAQETKEDSSSGSPTKETDTRNGTMTVSLDASNRILKIEVLTAYEVYIESGTGMFQSTATILLKSQVTTDVSGINEPLEAVEAPGV
jgi:hypothetical protein